MIEEPPHRTLLKKQVLPFMFDHLDDCFLGTPGYMSIRPKIRTIVRQIKSKDFDINSYRRFSRRQRLGADRDVRRYFEACVSFVDGRFKDWVAAKNTQTPKKTYSGAPKPIPNGYPKPENG